MPASRSGGAAVPDVECFDTIGAIDPARWQGVTAGQDLAYSPAYMRYLESQEPGCRPLLMLGDLAACCLAEFSARSPFTSKPASLLTDRQYLRIGRPDEPAAVPELRSALAGHAGDALPPDLGGLLRRAWQTFVTSVGMPVVVRNLWDSRVLLATGLEPAARRYALARMIEAVKSEAIRRGYRSVAFVYTPGEDAALQRALRAAGFARALIGGLTAIDLRGCATFDDYLDRFRSRGRQRIRAEIRQFAEAGLRVQRIDHAAAVRQMAELELATSVRHDRPVTLPQQRNMHAALSQAFGDRLVACGVTSGDRLVASAAMLRGDRELRVLLYGAGDEPIARLPGVYGSAVAYWPIRQALAWGLDTVRLGYEGYDAKLLRGARLLPRYIQVWTASAAGRAFLADWLSMADARAAQFFLELEAKYHNRCHAATPTYAGPHHLGR